MGSQNYSINYYLRLANLVSGLIMLLLSGYVIFSKIDTELAIDLLASILVITAFMRFTQAYADEGVSDWMLMRQLTFGFVLFLVGILVLFYEAFNLQTEALLLAIGMVILGISRTTLAFSHPNYPIRFQQFLLILGGLSITIGFLAFLIIDDRAAQITILAFGFVLAAINRFSLFYISK